MFKRHVYTCPDVIYDRKRAKTIFLTYTVTMIVGVAGLNVYGWIASRKDRNELALVTTPEEN